MQHKLKGIIIDAATKEPIQGALVHQNDTEVNTADITQKDGSFELVTQPDKKRSINIVHPDYREKKQMFYINDQTQTFELSLLENIEVLKQTPALPETPIIRKEATIIHPKPKKTDWQNILYMALVIAVLVIIAYIFYKWFTSNKAETLVNAQLIAPETTPTPTPIIQPNTPTPKQNTPEIKAQFAQNTPVNQPIIKTQYEIVKM